MRSASPAIRSSASANSVAARTTKIRRSRSTSLKSREAAMSRAMIRMTGMQGPGPVQLLREHHPHQAVGEGQRREREPFVGTLETGRVEAVRSADEKDHVAPLLLPGGEFLRQAF